MHFRRGIAAYLEAHGIEEKLYYRRFQKLRKTHPQWKDLTRGGRKTAARDESAGSKTSLKASQPSRKVAKTEQNFAPVHFVEQFRVVTVNEPAFVEIILSNSVVLRGSPGSTRALILRRSYQNAE